MNKLERVKQIFNLKESNRLLVCLNEVINTGNLLLSVLADWEEHESN